MAVVKPKLRHWVQYVAGRGVLARAQRRAVRRWRERLVAGWAGSGYSPLGIRRNVVQRQIAGAFPDASASQVDALTREAYAHFGEVMIETALLPKLGRQGILDLFRATEGFEAIEEAHTAGKGIILITGHFGNWELAGAYVASRGIPIEAIVRRMNNPLFDSYVTRTRAGAGMIVVHDHDAVRRTPRAFKCRARGRVRRGPGCPRPRVHVRAVLRKASQDAARAGGVRDALSPADVFRRGGARA